MDINIFHIFNGRPKGWMLLITC